MILIQHNSAHQGAFAYCQHKDLCLAHLELNELMDNITSLILNKE